MNCNYLLFGMYIYIKRYFYSILQYIRNITKVSVTAITFFKYIAKYHEKTGLTFFSFRKYFNTFN